MNTTNGAVMERPRTGLIRRMFCALDSPTDEELSVCGVLGCLNRAELVEPVGDSPTYWSPSCAAHRLYDGPGD
jgi:hypothetical protein